MPELVLPDGTPKLAPLIPQDINTLAVAPRLPGEWERCKLVQRSGLARGKSSSSGGDVPGVGAG